MQHRLPPEHLHHLSPQEWYEWQLRIQAANQNNIFHHCMTCDREWVASEVELCVCGSKKVEHLACWQFPDG